jgi:Protein of unknown function (DUF3137).
MSDIELLEKLKAKKGLQSLCKAFMYLCGTLSIVALVVIPVVAKKEGPWFIPALIFVLLLVVTLSAWAFSNHIETELEKELGTGFIEKILSERVDLINYQPFKAIGFEPLRNSKLFDLFDRIKGSDYFKAVYNGVTFEYCDAMLTSRDNYGDTNTNITEFEGGILRMKITNPIKGTVIVREKNNKNAEALEAAAKRKAKAGFTIVKSGNEEFDTRFSVETEIEGEESIILTPEFIGRMSKLSEDTAGRLFISLQENDVTAAISRNEDYFDMPPVHKMENAAKFKELYRNQLSELLTVVNAFTAIPQSDDIIG